MAAFESIPSPRLIESLRGMGYDFSQAVADVVDNAIEARAKTIRIDVEFDGDESWVRISDDGCGMNPEELREALRYGSVREYEEEDLGKFGLGLKTASLSQCQRLSVASRWNPDRIEIHAYAWDLAHVKKSGRWEILPVRSFDRGPGLHQLLRDSPGTVVLWERLDRILGYKHPYGEAARKRMAQMCRELEQHLGMVLHRFITGEAKRNVRVLINDNEVRAWDPFCRSEPKTIAWDPIYLKVDEQDGRGTVRVEPYILPHQSDFSSPAAFRNASGPSGWNQQQGLYVYRAGRMIQSGGWSRLRTADEHTKLARLGVSFMPALDEPFKINVAKMRVQVPPSIKLDLEKIAQQLTKEARRVYDRKERRITTNGAGNGAVSSENPRQPGKSPDGSDATRAGRGTEAFGAAPRALWTHSEWSKLVLGAATVREKPIVQKVLDRVRDDGI